METLSLFRDAYFAFKIEARLASYVASVINYFAGKLASSFGDLQG